MSVSDYEHKPVAPTLRIVSCDGGARLQDKEPASFAPYQPDVGDYLKDFEDAAGYGNTTACAEVYECLKEVYVPDKTLEVIDVFTTSRHSTARLAAAVLTKQWLTEAYTDAEWPELVPAFEALLHDKSPSVLAKALQARKAFIASAASPLEAQRRIKAVRRLRMPSFATAYSPGLAQKLRYL